MIDGVGATPFGKHEAGVITRVAQLVVVRVTDAVALIVAATVSTRHGVLVTEIVEISVLVVVVVFFGGHGRVV